METEFSSVESLPPGNYKVEIEKAGFENIVKPDLVLHTQDTLEINFELRVGSSSETITVTDSANAINTSPAVSMTVTRDFVENTPLNGRSFQDCVVAISGTLNIFPILSGPITELLDWFQQTAPKLRQLIFHARRNRRVSSPGDQTIPLQAL
jgi:hypothetical protein